MAIGLAAAQRMVGRLLMEQIGASPLAEGARKVSLSRSERLVRLIKSVLNIRAWLHLVKIVNYYNYSHVKPMQVMRPSKDCRISPDVNFSNERNIVIGARVSIGSRCFIWAGPEQGRVVIGDDVLFGPDVLITAANYRFNDGAPVTKQLMDEADVVIGRDVWLGARVIVLPGATIGDGAIIGAGALVRGDIPANAIAVGVPARVVGTRQIPST